MIESLFYDDEHGNEQKFWVGKNCKKITCYPARGEGDRWRWVVETDDKIITVFNPIRTIESKESEQG